MMKRRFELIIILPVLLVVLSCSWMKSTNEQIAKRQKPNPFNLPAGVKNADSDKKIYLEESLVLDLPNNSDIQIGGQNRSKDDVRREIARLKESPGYDRKTVYIRANAEIDYASLIEVFKLVRNENIDYVSLVVDDTDGKLEKPFGVFELKIPPADGVEHFPLTPDSKKKPNPLTLVVVADNNGKVRLNSEYPYSPEDLTAQLKLVFTERENNGILREGTNEVEKTIFIKAPRSMRYGDFIRVVDAARGSRASPVYLLIDDLSE